jgi:hypothetical protein
MPRSFEPRQFQCIKRAEDARRRAHSASGVRERAELLQVEQRWLGLAESYALSDRISLFNCRHRFGATARRENGGSQVRPTKH